MPTPFTHLAAAKEFLELPGLSPEVRQSLQAELPAFLLGNIAPDVQTISGQPREATHFFPVPLGRAPPAGERLLAEYPALGRRQRLAPAHAAFLAGYLAHLVFDQLWIGRIFDPIFGERQAWGTFRERLYLHNALRAYWDAADVGRLPADEDERLHRAEPAGWLPFVAEPHLRTWRDLVADQLGLGASRTAEVFARRMHADPHEFAALVASPQAMAERVFTRVAPEALDAYRAEALARSQATVEAYW